MRIDERKRTKVLLGKLGLDGHDLGLKMVARALRDEGMEIVYLGLNQTPAEMVSVALEEDVDVVGVSFYSGSHMMLTERLIGEFERRRADGVKIVVGGIIPRDDVDGLIRMGVDGVFAAGTPMGEITDTIRELTQSS